MRKLFSDKRVLFAAMLLAILAESMTAPFLKLGGRHPFLSMGYILWFLGAMAILAIYAVIWQLILEHVPLTVAYLRKGLSYVLALVWAAVIFQEIITWKQILGISLIIVGMVVSISDER